MFTTGGGIGDNDAPADLRTVLSGRSEVHSVSIRRPSWPTALVSTFGSGRARWIDRCISPAALAVYLALTVGLFGGPLLANPAGVSLGGRGDPPLFMWCLTWWPHALLHRLNP